MLIAAVVITLNEQPRIKDCLRQLAPHVNHLIVLDGGSKDKTVEIAKGYADVIEVMYFANNAMSRNYAWRSVHKDFDWVLFVDADERLSDDFLKNMSQIIAGYETLAFSFPRKNLPDLKDFPDYQVRLLRNNGEIEWRGVPHDRPWHIKSNMLVDQVSTVALLEYPMIHLPRRNDINRSWW